MLDIISNPKYFINAGIVLWFSLSVLNSLIGAWFIGRRQGIVIIPADGPKIFVAPAWIRKFGFLPAFQLYRTHGLPTIKPVKLREEDIPGLPIEVHEWCYATQHLFKNKL